jgi:hypothetical protein
MERNVVGERAVRVAGSRLEVLESQCPTAAASGRETVGRVKSEWNVTPFGSALARASESVSYETSSGSRTDVYDAVFSCAR